MNCHVTNRAVVAEYTTQFPDIFTEIVYAVELGELVFVGFVENEIFFSHNCSPLKIHWASGDAALFEVLDYFIGR